MRSERALRELGGSRLIFVAALIAVLTVAMNGEVNAAGFSAAAPMITGRFLHTATLLPSGKVLVTGGTDGANALSSAELYDPALNTWSATGSLSPARYGHTATLLLSGKVLVTGGTSGGNYLSSAELYDPALSTWSAASNLITARLQHTATLLPSGKVLVAGGVNGNYNFLSSAEVYDPAVNTWSAAGSLSAARDNHTATLLSSGKVLIAGGTGGNVLSSAEVYDPAVNTWSATGSLSAARDLHTATLLPSGKVLVAGGDNNSGDLSGAEVYDPASGVWSATGSLITARQSHTATLLPSGKVLIAGGTGGNVLSSAELFDVNLPVALTITSPANASPNPAFEGQSISFTVAATDPSNGTLTYAWDFGDSQSGGGASVAHSFAGVGTFDAKVTISNSGGRSIQSSVAVAVSPAPIVLAAIGKMKVLPFDVLTLQCSGHAVGHAAIVRFKTMHGNIDVLVKNANATSIEVVVPPYTDRGKFGQGKVDVQIMQGIRSSNSVSGLSVLNLPHVKTKPGVATLSYLTAQRGIAAECLIQASGTVLNTADFVAKLKAQIASLDVIIADVQKVVRDPRASTPSGGPAQSAGRFDKKSLAISDQIILGLLHGQSAQTGTLGTISLNWAAAINKNDSASIASNQALYVSSFFLTTRARANRAQGAFTDLVEYTNYFIDAAAALTAASLAEDVVLGVILLPEAEAIVGAVLVCGPIIAGSAYLLYAVAFDAIGDTTSAAELSAAGNTLVFDQLDAIDPSLGGDGPLGDLMSTGEAFYNLAELIVESVASGLIGTGTATHTLSVDTSFSDVTITSQPGGIDTSLGKTSASFDSGTTVTLHYTIVNTQDTFAYWTLDNIQSQVTGDLPVTMSADHTVGLYLYGPSSQNPKFVRKIGGKTRQNRVH